MLHQTFTSLYQYVRVPAHVCVCGVERAKSISDKKDFDVNGIKWWKLHKLAVCEGMTRRGEVYVCVYVCGCVSMLVCVKKRERLYNCSEWLVIQVGLEWRGRLVMQPQLEMSLCHSECVCVCVFVMCVFWLITRISQLYCPTDPLWSVLQTGSPFYLSSLHSFFLSLLLFLSALKSTSNQTLFIP